MYQKLAFFFQFKDNHIYNFEYEGTFIEELLDNGCILEMSKQGAMTPDEDINGAGFDSHGSSIDNIHHNQFEMASSSNPLLDQSHMSQPPRQRSI